MHLSKVQSPNVLCFIFSDPPGCVFTAKCLATDGRYIFLHCSRGLYKIGSGSFGTEKGKIYASDTNFHLSEKVWIGWASVSSRND